MSKIENTADGTVRLNQEYPARENPQLTDILLVGNLESGEIGNTTAGQIKTLYTGAIAENNSGFVRGDEVSAALALKADSESVNTALDTKVDKVAGMGLSHEDYTAPEKDDVATLSMFYKPMNDALDAVNGEAVRGGMPGKLAKLLESKENIRQAIIHKGVDVKEQEPVADYAEKISRISRTSDWEPDPMWWDIETILKEDTEEYPYKAIVLMGNNYQTFDIDSTYAYKTSDGQVYDHVQAIHTWDPAADKPGDKGCDTRYVIIYGTTYQSVYSGVIPGNALYVIFSQNWTVKSRFLNTPSLQAVSSIDGQPIKLQQFDPRPEYDIHTFGGGYSLQRVRADLSSFTAGMRLWAYCGDLKSMDVDLPNVQAVNRAWELCSGLHSLVAHTPKCTNFDEAWYACRALKSLKTDLSQAKHAVNALKDCRSLTDLDLTSIPVNIDLSYCQMLSAQSLARVLDQLVDYTGRESHTLTLGSELLSRLTDEQKAIATNKNWVLA